LIRDVNKAHSQAWKEAEMNDFPKRKSIRLKNYDYSSAGYYFITICTKDKYEYFGKIVGDDAHIVPPYIKHSEYGLIVEKYISNISEINDDIYIDKYTIMPNHIHMIIVICNRNGTMWALSPTNNRISNIVRSLKTLVTKQTGFPIWQRSFHDYIIRTENEYRRMWKYIDENPINWTYDEYYA